jgi:hypothetical protein
LVIRVGDARCIELRSEVIRCNDVASNAREWAGGHADEETFAGDGIFDDFFGSHDFPVLAFLPSERIDDLFVHRQDDWIREIAVGVRLRDADACSLEMAFGDEPARRFWDEGQNDDAED